MEPLIHTIAALLNITDSRFQDRLMQTAQQNGKLQRDYRIPDAFQNNRPERLAEQFKALKANGLCPAFPFGTDLTEIEIVLGKTLQALKAKLGTPGGAAKAVARALEVRTVPAAAEPYLARMGLASPDNLKHKMARKMIVVELIARVMFNADSRTVSRFQALIQGFSVQPAICRHIRPSAKPSPIFDVLRARDSPIRFKSSDRCLRKGISIPCTGKG